MGFDCSKILQSAMPDVPRTMNDTILELIGLIYESVADGSRWPLFLEALLQAIQARRGALVILDTTEAGSNMICWRGWSNEEIQLFLDRYSAIDPWRIRGARWPEGTVGTDADLCSREEMESSVAFLEFYAPHDAIHGIGGTIMLTSAGRSIFSATRGAGDGPFGEAEKALLRPLMPPLKRAALLRGELGSLRRQLAMLTDHLNRYAHAFLLADASARIFYANLAAGEVTGRRDGIAMENGHLRIASAREDTAFRKAAVEISSGRGAPLRRFVVSRPSQRKPYRLILMPVEDSGSIPLGVSVPTMSILVVDAESRPEPDVPILCELFSLTAAEARVAGNLALGLSIKEIAASLGISVETVRTHIKRTFAKTGTERQGELISLILRSTPLRGTQKFRPRTRLG
jgi:DNA-binding CsgD family transcriptional regulator